MKNIIAIVVTACAFLMAQEEPKFEYIGSNKCKACHSSKKKGAQYKVWAATAHVKAFETLQTEKAVNIAKEKGISALPHEAPECLACHTTGYGKGGYEAKDEEFWNPAEDDKAGKKAVKRMKGLQAVGCEACHGAGSGYKKKKTMEAIYADSLEAASVGLHYPNEETCTTCHNEKSPTHTPFDFEERVKEIAHPYPPDMGEKGQ